MSEKHGLPTQCLYCTSQIIYALPVFNDARLKRIVSVPDEVFRLFFQYSTENVCLLLDGKWEYKLMHFTRRFLGTTQGIKN